MYAVSSLIHILLPCARTHTHTHTHTCTHKCSAICTNVQDVQCICRIRGGELSQQGGELGREFKKTGKKNTPFPLDTSGGTDWFGSVSNNRFTVAADFLSGCPQPETLSKTCECTCPKKVAKIQSKHAKIQFPIICALCTVAMDANLEATLLSFSSVSANFLICMFIACLSCTEIISLPVRPT